MPFTPDNNMTPKERAVFNAVADLTHTITELCDYLWWLKTGSPEDQADIHALKQHARDATFALYQTLNAVEEA